MPGWKMTDRFTGFRFECSIRKGSDRVSFIEAVRDEADALSGFGWVQVAKTSGNVVGEFRGNKLTAGMMQRFLATGGSERVADVVFEEHELALGETVEDKAARARARDMEERLIR